MNDYIVLDGKRYRTAADAWEPNEERPMVVRRLMSGGSNVTFGHAGRQVGQEADAGSAGFYFQIAPGDSFMGAGIWMPPRSSLTRIREALVENHLGFGRVVASDAVRRRFVRLDQESMLKRMPRGFAEDHPAALWLRYQSFTLGRLLTEEEVLSPRLAALLERDFTRLTPMVRWLNAALGYPPAASR